MFLLSRPETITVGRLGRFDFAPGWYYYVGSAQRNLQARIARHARKRKRLRWHIDYLSRRAEMLGAILIDAPRSEECRIAADLARRMRRPIPGFGASDFRCGGHLFCEAHPPAESTP